MDNQVLRSLDLNKVYFPNKIPELISLLNEGLQKSQLHNFTDFTFPPSQDSICSNSETANLRVQNWQRLSEIYDFSKVSLFPTEFTPNDVLQGELSDCHLINALSSMALYPSTLKNLILNNSPSKFGIYFLQLFVNGESRFVLIDDFIPVKFKNCPIFAIASEGDAIWMYLIEKAYAKIHSNYDIMQYGSCVNVYKDLIGCPSQQIETTHQNLEEILLDYYQKKYLLSVSTGAEEVSEQELISKGLKKAHSYSILDVSKNLQGKVMLKLRDP